MPRRPAPRTTAIFVPRQAALAPPCPTSWPPAPASARHRRSGRDRGRGRRFPRRLASPRWTRPGCCARRCGGRWVAPAGGSSGGGGAVGPGAAPGGPGQPAARPAVRGACATRCGWCSGTAPRRRPGGVRATRRPGCSSPSGTPMRRASRRWRSAGMAGWPAARCSAPAPASPQRALVTARPAATPEAPPQMLLVPLCRASAPTSPAGPPRACAPRRPARSISPGWRLTPDMASAAGRHLRQPDFSAGAWRFAAVQCGGLEAVLGALREHLRRTGRGGDPHQAARLGQAAMAAETARLWVESAALRAEADPPPPRPRPMPTSPGRRWSGRRWTCWNWRSARSGWGPSCGRTRWSGYAATSPPICASRPRTAPWAWPPPISWRPRRRRATCGTCHDRRGHPGRRLAAAGGARPAAGGRCRRAARARGRRAGGGAASGR